MRSGYRTFYTILIAIGTIPFFVWRFKSKTIWPELSLGVYVLTAYQVLMSFLDYPGAGNKWYWKAVVAATALHCLVVSAIGAAGLAISMEGIRPPTGVLFTLITAALGMQAWARVRFFVMFDDESQARHKSRNHHASMRF
jgi:hypothetical protein